MKISINFNSDSWACGDALVNIFFSDWAEVREEDVYRSSVKACVLFHVTNTDKHCDILEDKEEQSVSDIIKKLKILSPALKENLHRSPLVWTRLAFSALRNNAHPSDFFLDRLARWRFRRTLKNGPETVTCETRINQDQKKINIDGQAFYGYTLDQFFLSPKIQADLCSVTQWKLVPAISGDFAKPFLAKQIRQKKTALPDTKPQKSTAENVGRSALTKIQKCITHAAENKTIEELQKDKIGTRYLCSISRAKLAKKLHRKYGAKLKCRESTILRALSDFVACPNYRKK